LPAKEVNHDEDESRGSAMSRVTSRDQEGIGKKDGLRHERGERSDEKFPH
jgi:hypothetical protein